MYAGSERVLPWDRRVRILKDYALGLKFLHMHPDGCIVHRDIKVYVICFAKENLLYPSVLKDRD